MGKKTKKCSRCGKRKRVHLFSHSQSNADGLHSWCKACHNSYVQERREADPSRRKRDRWITKTYNRALAELRDQHPEEFEELLDRVREEVPSP